MILKNLILLITLAFLSTPGFAQAKIDVSKVAWLTGCWEMKNEKSGSLTAEQWTTSSGGTIFGIGRTFNGIGKLVSWELMRIAQEGESAKFYAQLPDAAQATAFALKSATADELVFENLNNDFPHRVIYRNAGVEKLSARIEGMMNAKATGVDFAFSRVKCEKK